MPVDARINRRRTTPVFALALSAMAVFTCSAAAEPRHALAMHGEPAYQPGFTHFRYANPDAPKGGRFTQGIIGSFDSMNPLIVRGNAFQYVRTFVIESLLARGSDEPFTLYGLIAEKVETDAERSFVTFHLNPLARFSDGKPVTPDDILFSWELLRDKGRPNHRGYYSKVTKAEKRGERIVHFELGRESDGSYDRELPLILGLMPVLPRHAIDAAKFDESTLTPLPGSGPYKVTEVRAGESVTLTRDPNYWGRDLAVNKGHYNFDELRYDFFRDANTWFEAFKRGLYDVRFETDPGRWADQYDFPAAKSGGLIRESIKSGQPKPYSSFVFNTRKPPFSDIRVREALIELFDFEWVNKNLFHGAYQRTASFYEGSELSARGRPADERERALLKPLAHALRPDVLEGKYNPPVSDGSGRDRASLKRVIDLLTAAGYELKGGKMIEKKNGEPFSFEIMVALRDDERLALSYQSMLRRAGIDMRVRYIDGAQYERRRQNYEFEMMPYIWQQSLSPGNEQAFYFGSAAADVPGTRNYMGAKNPAVDALITALLTAREREDFVASVRALDRVLMSGLYAIPLFHLPEQWIARWPAIRRPDTTSLYGTVVETWWRNEANPATLPR
jgi:peptide/nickel transport system substrate-binding protein